VSPDNDSRRAINQIIHRDANLGPGDTSRDRCSIALAKSHEEETGKALVPDSDFAADVQDILNHRGRWNPPAWK
jgi:hypothetical protein